MLLPWDTLGDIDRKDPSPVHREYTVYEGRHHNQMQNEVDKIVVKLSSLHSPVASLDDH